MTWDLTLIDDERAGGRTNQRRRTRGAIMDAARQLVRAGADLSMPAVAAEAGVSEATAYRYFPDRVSLLGAAMGDVWLEPAVAMAVVEGSSDPVERVACATEVLLRQVAVYQSAARAMIAATVTRRDDSHERATTGRLGLIDHALAPLHAPSCPIGAEAVGQLRRDLAVIVSEEAFFTLTDLCGLSPDQAIASAARTARTVTEAAIRM